MKKFGQRLRTLRRDHKLTQERAAEKAGLDVKHWQAIESGESNITIASLVGIAKACGASLSELFEGV